MIHFASCRRFAVICAALLLPGCDRGQSPRLHTFDGLTMGSTYTVKINAAPLPAGREDIHQAISHILDAINSSMSTYLETSELSRLNRNPSTAWIPVSAALYAVLEKAAGVSALSAGAFDVTVGPLINLWGFGPPGPVERVPADAEIAAALARVGYLHLELDPAQPAIRKHLPEMYIDLSAIAQGYAADEIARYLAGIGVRNFMAEVAGEIRASGVNPEGEIWRIGIERPGNGERNVERIVSLKDTGLATSGDYRNYFEKEGVRYSHEIDPATGRPINHRLASVTVVHPSATFADAMATALMVLGPERGYALAVRENLAAFFILRSESGFVEKRTAEFDKLLLP